jgi:hypothetical protein
MMQDSTLQAPASGRRYPFCIVAEFEVCLN